MRTAQDIYEEYRIPPWLQQHQVRAAAVGDALSRLHDVSRDDVVAACLLHDIGAIVKFDFSRSGSPADDLCPEDELEYWRGVQQEFRTKYGIVEHPATDAVIREIGVRDRVRKIVADTGFEHMEEMLEADRLEAMIVQYADMRVGLTGIMPMDDRLADVERRYNHRHDPERSKRFENYLVQARKIEKRLFEGTNVGPEYITEEALSRSYEKLRKFPIF